MISRKGLRAAFVLITTLAVSASAQAATIDFGATEWKLANGESSFSVGDVTATAGPAGATLSFGPDLGLGIDYVTHPANLAFDDESLDQIELMEMLTITFATPSLIESFTLSNLFRETTCERGCGNEHYDEGGFYSIDGGSTWVEFKKVNAGNGKHTVQLGGVSLKEIVFSADTEDFRYDFSLASIETVDEAADAVPEPMSMMLMGAALLIGGARLRRRK